MSHEPDVLPQIASYGVDLMLSGHTHGGQIRFPFVPPMYLPPLGRIYLEGAFRLGTTQMYVNRGIGAVLVPVRLNCRPEITQFTLV
jgi:predicted MPP superfamily phosphohydrolase